MIFANCTSEKSSECQTDSGFVWGTTYTIKYIWPENLSDCITRAMARVDSTFSAFNPASELSAINRGEAVRPGGDMLRVLGLSRRIHALSGGAFDPTVAPLVRLWGFGTDRPGERPTDRQIDSALALTGLERCTIDTAGYYRGPQLDFAAIAKGYGVDLVAAALRQAGVENYMVEIGGEMALAGHSPSGGDWRIQIDAPVDDADPTAHHRQRVVSLTDCGVATSGNYRNRRTLPDGSLAWHTIDPRTGRPAVTDMLSATVIAPDCATADALATAALAMPSDSALAMLSALPGIRALLVVADSTSTKTIPLRL